MPPFLPIRAANRSQGVRIGKKHITTDVTTYIDLGNFSAYPPILKELQNHLSIGAIIVVGALSNKPEPESSEPGPWMLVTPGEGWEVLAGLLGGIEVRSESGGIIRFRGGFKAKEAIGIGAAIGTLPETISSHVARYGFGAKLTGGGLSPISVYLNGTLLSLAGATFPSESELFMDNVSFSI